MDAPSSNNALWRIIHAVLWHMPKKPAGQSQRAWAAYWISCRDVNVLSHSVRIFPPLPIFLQQIYMYKIYIYIFFMCLWVIDSLSLSLAFLYNTASFPQLFILFLTLSTSSWRYNNRLFLLLITSSSFSFCSSILFLAYYIAACAFLNSPLAGVLRCCGS